MPLTLDTVIGGVMNPPRFLQPGMWSIENRVIEEPADTAREDPT